MDLDRLYEWQHVAIGALGLALTLAVATPGEHSVAVGPLAFDPFYVPVGCFVFLLGWSVLELYQLRDER